MRATTQSTRGSRFSSRQIAHFVGSFGQFFGALALLGAAASGGLSSFVVRTQYKNKGVPSSTTSFFALSVGALLTLPIDVDAAAFQHAAEPPRAVS